MTPTELSTRLATLAEEFRELARSFEPKPTTKDYIRYSMVGRQHAYRDCADKVEALAKEVGSK